MFENLIMMLFAYNIPGCTRHAARFGKAKSTMRTGFPKLERIQTGQVGIDLGKGRRIGIYPNCLKCVFFGTRRTGTKVPCLQKERLSASNSLPWHIEERKIVCLYNSIHSCGSKLFTRETGDGNTQYDQLCGPKMVTLWS